MSIRGIASVIVYKPHSAMLHRKRRGKPSTRLAELHPRAWKGSTGLASVLLLIGAGIVASCDSANPVTPTREQGLAVLTQDHLEIWDAATDSVLRRVTLPEPGIRILTSSDPGRVLVETLEGLGAPPRGRVYEVDVSTGDIEFVSTFPARAVVEEGRPVVLVGYTAAGAASQGSRDVYVVDSEGPTRVGSVGIKPFSRGSRDALAIHPSKPYLYGITPEDDILVFDYQAGLVVDTLEHDVRTNHAVVLSSSGRLVFYPGGAIVDTERNELVGVVPTRPTAFLARSQRRNEIYATDSPSPLPSQPLTGLVTVLSGQTGETIGVIDVGAALGAMPALGDMVVSQDGETGYVVDGQIQVHVLDLVERELIRTIPLPRFGSQITTVHLQ